MFSLTWTFLDSFKKNIEKLYFKDLFLLTDGHSLGTTLNLIASPKLLPFLSTIKAQSRH